MRRSALFCLFIAALLYGLRVYATHIEPKRLTLRHVFFETEKVNRPIRILHMSDIQSAGVGAYEKRAFEMAQRLEPDLVIHTGDLLQPLPPATWETEIPKMAALFQSIDPPLGKFGICGDTDGFLLAKEEKELGGLVMLASKEVVLTMGSNRIRLLGLHLPQSRSDPRAQVSGWLERTRPEDFTILSGHSPDYVLYLRDYAIDLCLAGHTHGGQVNLPLLGPIIISSGVPRAWARGFRTVGRAHLNVSAGVGCEHAHRIPPIRFNCPPEMTLIELAPCR